MVDIASLAIQIDTSDVARAERDLDKLSNKGAKSERAAKGVGDAHDKATGKVGALGTSARKTGDALDKGARSAGAYAGKIAAMAAPLLSVAAAMAAINKVSDVQRQFDVLNAGLVTATGSAKNAQVAFSALQDFASQTPYDLAQAVEGFTKLVNLGLTPSEKALRSYGNTASALGKDLNQMIEAVADASTGEFERLKEFGIKAKQNGEQVSLTFQGMTKTIGNNAAEIEKYLTDLGENQFAGAMTQRMATLDGAISNLGDSWDAFALNISNAGAGDLMEEAVRQAIDALDELNAQLESGQLEAQLGAIAGKFDGWGSDISQTLDIVGDIFESATGRWGALVDNNVENMTSTFANFPENVRAFIQLMTVEVLNGFEKVTAYSAAFKDGIKAIFTDDTMEGVGARLEADLQRLNSVRDESISSILEERDAALTSYSDQMAAAQDLRKVYDEALERSAKSTEDRLAKFKALGDSAGTASEGVAKLGKKLKEIKQLDATGPGDAINDYIKQFEKLHDELNPAEVAAREYGKQQDLLNDIIARGGENADKARGDLAKLREQYEENTRATSEWAKWTEGALERVDGAFADAWKNIGDGFSGFRDSLTNAFKQMLAELAHMAITRPIVMQIGAALGIGGGSAGAGLISLGGGAGGSGGSLLADAWNYGSSAYSAVTSGFGQAVMAGWNSGGLTGAFAGGWGYGSNAISGLGSTVSGWGSTAAGWFGGGSAAGAGAGGAGFGLGQPLVTGGVGNAGFASAGGLGSPAWGSAGSALAGVGAALYGYGQSGWKGAVTGGAGAYIGAALGSMLGPLGTALGGALGGWIGGSLFGGDWQTKDVGISLRADDGQFIGQRYEYQKKKGGLFGGGGSRFRYRALDEETNAALQSTFDATQEGVVGLFEALSYDIEDGVFAGLDIARKRISTKGKTEEKIQQAIAEWFGTAANAMTAELQSVFNTGLDLDLEGMQAFVGNLQGVNEVLRYLDVGMYDASVAGGKLAEALSAAAGGLDALAANSQTYYAAFFTEAEKVEDTVDSIKRAFESADVELAASREAYRAMVEDIDLTSEAGQKMFATMMALSGQAAQYYSIVEQQAAAAAAQALANTLLYYEQFTTAGQKTEDVLAGIVAQFEDLELALPGTRDGFIAAVDALDTTTEAGKKMFDTLMGVAGAADAYYDILEARAASVSAGTANAAVAASRGALSTLSAAINAEKSSIASAYQAQADSIRSAIGSANDSLSQMRSVASSLRSAVNGLRLESEQYAAQSRRSAQQAIRQALSGGGRVQMTEPLERALGTVSQSSEDLFGSFEDYARDYWQTYFAIEQLAERAEDQLSSDELAVKALERQLDQSQRFHEAEIERLDGVLEGANAQLEALLGIDTSVQSVETALAAFTAALAAAQKLQNANSSVTSVTGLGGVKRQVTSEGYILDELGNQMELFGEAMRVVGNKVVGGMGATLNIGADGQLSWAAGDYEKWAREAGIPGFASGGLHSGGLRLVGENGPELEVTGPSRIYNASQTAAMLGGGGDAAAEVRGLRADFGGMMSALRSVAKHTMQTAKRVEFLERWDFDGLPKERATA